ncbi:MAG TPA: NAD(+)/NADH kinase [Acidimicrobiia bacterium]
MNLQPVIHARREQSVEFARRFASRVEVAGAKLVGGPEVAELLPEAHVGDGPPDVVVAIGGDGTMLAAAHWALEYDVPVVGFNLGTVGFLAEAEPSDLDLAVEALVSGSFRVDERMTIEADLPSGIRVTGINDVVAEKIDSQRLVSLKVTIDDQEFLTYRADGLIVSTPTGSTAYSFSAGGPLLDPGLQALLVTPVAAHSLFARTMALLPTSVVGVEVAADRPVRVSIDGIEGASLHQGERFEVRRGLRPARFVRLKEQPFPRLVTEKFRLK